MWEALPLAFGAFALRYAVRGTTDLLRDRSLLRREPISIASVREGFCVVRGQVATEEGRLLEGPLSGTPCVMAHSRVFDLEGPVARRDVATAFLLDDGTGRLRIVPEPEHTRFLFPWNWERSVAERELDTRARSLLRPGYTVQERGRRERTLQLVEGMLFPGDTIYALGYARREVSADGDPAGYREPPSLSVLTGSGRHGLIICSGDPPSLRRAALFDLGKGVAGLAAAALGVSLF